MCELEQTVSLLPVMVGSSNIQAEIALVLQPLRSENALLRRSAPSPVCVCVCVSYRRLITLTCVFRRLRIVNQQLRERERAEREARDVHCDTDSKINCPALFQLSISERLLSCVCISEYLTSSVS